ncbi:MAG: SH3 domain-containing protein [Clostridium sp.]|nr:SH3 domain-containing protein [Acetatifactor muris]MCM1527213.1 SH3 domain-containing protein [Bacteroides sp.]MCM1562462.1 SH3 domain-containing protein [Clostridium sp.]
MWRDKLRSISNYLLKHSKIAFPVLAVAVVAVTVSIALGAAGNRRVEDIVPETGSGETQGTDGTDVEEDVPLISNEDEAIKELMLKYYNAQALGDLETLQSMCDEISDLDLLSFEEKAKYIESYPALEIYTKKGMNAGETIVYVYYKMTFANHEEEFPGYTSHYVCTAEDGSLYIKRNNFSDELNEYTGRVCAQEDVIEFNNRVIAEYDAFKETHPELANYPEEVMAQVNMTVGVKWSELQAAAAGEDAPEGQPDESGQPAGEPGDAQEPAEAGPLYATATTTVNVRSSDSEQADRLGKVTQGTRLEVKEQRVNGWSQVVYEGKDGFIKSEYLSLEESADSATTVGTVRAKTTVNVRATADQNGTRLGALAEGDTAELIAVEGEWCKIKYSGRTAYVKAEYVEQE